VLDNGKMRQISAKSIDPIAKIFLKAGITPDAVTVFGAFAASAISVIFISQGEFLLGGILLSLVGVSDLLDGTMARLSQSSGPWGAFLDSSLDRIVDGFVYGSIIFWIADQANLNATLLWAGIVGLIAAQITSYTRARWESVGVQGKVGLIERSERMIVICAALILTGLGLDIFNFAIYALAIASTFTVLQRILFVRKQLKKS
jgi:phosphatidylglycerophosphate synthase